MGLFGIAKGIVKIGIGIADGEVDQIFAGVKKVGVNLVSTIAVNEAHERIINDDDDDEWA